MSMHPVGEIKTMSTRNVVMNRNDTKILSISMKDREKLTQDPVTSAKYPGNLCNPTYVPKKTRVNKHIKQQGESDGI